MAGTERAGNGKRFLAVAFVVVGVGAMLVGILGTVNDWGATETAKTVAAAEVPTTIELAPPQTTSASEPTTAPTAAATTTTGAPAETPQQFLTLLGDAIAVGGGPFLMERLHPAVIERYGADQCATSVASTPDPAVKFEVVSFGQPETYAWTTDDLTTDIPDTLTVAVTRTSSAGSGPAVVHITLVDGTYRWFTDCGDPQPTG